jgi:(R,R)-butanediol dehydrogenase / meso-butanediol dehydrogenase / diacetyl reductase
MTTMKSVQTATAGKVDIVDVDRPVPGPKDALVRIRACGICGTDSHFPHIGGMPTGSDGQTRSIPLGHEPAGEIVAVGAEVAGPKVGHRVVVNPQGVPSGIIGCGGRHGGLSEYLLIEDAVVGKGVQFFPDNVPFDVAALNEPRVHSCRHRPPDSHSILIPGRIRGRTPRTGGTHGEVAGQWCSS